LDALFHCAVVEKNIYYSNKGSSSTSAAARLKKSAEALRVVIEHGIAKLRRKTLLAVIDHITQTLPGPDETLVEPLLQNYLKAFAALLGHSTNVELLATYEGEGWFSCVDFVLQTINQHLEAGLGDALQSRASPAPGTPQTFSMPVSTLRSQATTSTQRGGSRVQQSQLQQTLGCLYSLVSAPNAPILERSKAITAAVLQCLQIRYLGMTSVLQLSFSILNVVLTTSQTDDIDHTNSLIGELIPLIGYWWQAKTTSQDNALLNSIQVEVLKILFNTHLNIEHLIQLGDSSLVAEIENFCDVLWTEYSRRDDRAQLQQDDLTFSTVPQHAFSFKTHLFGLRPYNIEAERRWAVVHTLAILEGILWKQSQSRHVVREDGDEQPRKKRRTAAGSTRLRQKLQSPDHTVQFTALQVIPFFISNARMATSDIAETLASVSGLTGHKNAKLSAWSMLAAARFVLSLCHSRSVALADYVSVFRRPVSPPTRPWYRFGNIYGTLRHVT
jgi:ataxia telangiectasia mutated family protein